MVGGLILELVTGKRPFWWLPDSELLRTRFTTTQNAFDAAVASGHMSYIIEGINGTEARAIRMEIEALLRVCLSEKPGDRPEVAVILGKVIELERHAITHYA